MFDGVMVVSVGYNPKNQWGKGPAGWPWTSVDSRAAITEQGTWGAANGPVVRFNAPDIPNVRFSDLTGIRTSVIMCT